MKKVYTILGFLVFIFLGIGFIQQSYPPKKINFIIPKGWPQPVYNFKENPLTVEGFELGKKLFYDPLLSVDSTISCASCHQQFAAFATYDHDLSHGINNSLTTRNTPELQNLAWQKEFMADGSIHHLDVQPLFPLTAANEMGESLENILVKLQRSIAYKKMFKAAFNINKIETQFVTKALSQFMLMLVSDNSKYDKVMRKEIEFNLAEKLGYDIFKTKCASCHKEPLFTDLSYRNNGMPLDNFLLDEGRKKITLQQSDSLKFKVPSLRNVVLTFPYGHDGRFFTLQNVFEHYRKNMIVSSTTDSLLKNKMSLSNYEIGQLTSFLYTLTDSSFITNPKFAPQGYNITPSFIDKH